jgi:hypothetical protein
MYLHLYWPRASEFDESGRLDLNQRPQWFP